MSARLPRRTPSPLTTKCPLAAGFGMTVPDGAALRIRSMIMRSLPRPKCRPNTGDKLRGSNMLRLRHPQLLLARLVAFPTIGRWHDLADFVAGVRKASIAKMG